MSGKHQIFSSKKSTRQKANRSWRRKANALLKNHTSTGASKQSKKTLNSSFFCACGLTFQMILACKNHQRDCEVHRRFISR